MGGDPGDRGAPGNRGNPGNHGAGVHREHREPPGPAALRAGALTGGLLETLAVLAGFLTLGLGAAALFRQVPAGPRADASPYPPTMARDTVAEPEIWLVDGYNVLCTGLLGGQDRRSWWRAERRAELIARLGRLDARGAEVWVVFDGSRDVPDESVPGAEAVRSVFAPSADAWLLERVRALAKDRAVAVVTADRRVADRARHRGARVVSPRDLLERCMG